MSKSLFKRIGTSVVALSLVISSLSAVTASAEDSSDFQPSVTYTKGDLLLESSHILTSLFLLLTVLLITWAVEMLP